MAAGNAFATITAAAVAIATAAATAAQNELQHRRVSFLGILPSVINGKYPRDILAINLLLSIV